jgi:hypothetical protein
VHAVARKVTTGRPGIWLTGRLVVTAFNSLAVAAPVTYMIMLDGDGEYAQSVGTEGDGRRGAGADR